MQTTYKERVIAAVRMTGPDAYPSAVYGYMEDALGGGKSLGKLMRTLARLSEEGLLRERWVIDERGRDRRVYSMGTGMRRKPSGSGYLSGRLATAG